MGEIKLGAGALMASILGIVLLFVAMCWVNPTQHDGKVYRVTTVEVTGKTWAGREGCVLGAASRARLSGEKFYCVGERMFKQVWVAR